MAVAPKQAAAASKRDDVEEMLESIDHVPEELTSGIDRCVGIVRKEKSIRLDALAKKCAVKRDVALGWVRVLESAGMVRIHYPLLGELEVRA